MIDSLFVVILLNLMLGVAAVAGAGFLGYQLAKTIRNLFRQPR